MNINSILLNSKDQFRSNLRLLGIVYIPLLLFLAIVGIQPFVGFDYLTKDTIVILGGPIYAGMISDIGLYLWVASVTLCYFCAYIFYRLSIKDNVTFLLIFGTFSLVLLIDDRFMLHERTLERMFPLGLPYEYILYFLYLLTVCYILIRFHSLLSNSNYILLLIAGFFLGASIGYDTIDQILSSAQAFDDSIEQVSNVGRDYSFLIEDGFKLAGIVGWVLFISNFCYQQLTNVISFGDNLTKNS